MALFKVLLLGAFFLLLTACSEGSDNSTSADEAVLAGQFIDSALSGIRYETETRSGITNSNGQFEYLEGETVRFYIGDLLLGDAHDAATISLFDLVDDVNPVVGSALQKAILDNKKGPSFSTIINLATLLQTLDSDGIPENGIEVSASVAALFAADSVDFDRYWEDFNRDRGFRQALAEAKASALLDGNRQIRKPWRAMAHLYASLGIDSRLRVPDVSSSDMELPYRYEFDTDGQLTREEFLFSTGEISRVSTYAYDANGNLVREERDYDGNGLSDAIYTMAYDADGNRIREELYENGYSASNWIHTYTYDRGGNPIRVEQDDYGDGTLDWIQIYTYDASGNRVRIADYYYGDSTPHAIHTSTYDADNNLIRQEIDSDGNDMPDTISNYTYDASGNRIREVYDNDGDGTPETIINYTYDAGDNLTRREVDFSSHSSNGMPDMIETNTYDASGNLIREESALIVDGTSDTITVFINTRTYDADGNLIRLEYGDGNGIPNSISTMAYDADGNRIREEYDINGDGTPERISTHSFDADVDGWWWIFNRLIMVDAPPVR